jgi:hypothetical protein
MDTAYSIHSRPRRIWVLEGILTILLPFKRRMEHAENTFFSFPLLFCSGSGGQRLC